MDNQIEGGGCFLHANNCAIHLLCIVKDGLSP